MKAVRGSVAIFVIVAAAIAGPAKAASTRSILIGAAAMSSADGGSGWRIEPQGSQLLTLDGGGGCFVTQMNLPNGARLLRVTVRYRSPNFFSYVSLGRQEVLTSTTHPRLLRSLPRASERTAYSVPFPAGVVDNSRFTYSFGLCLGPSSTFYSAEVILQSSD